MSYQCRCGNYLINSWDKCPNCARIAAGERQAQQIADSNRQVAMAQLQVVAAQLQIVEAQKAAAEMNLRIANEQSLTDQQAYDLGYQLDFLINNPNAFNGCLNENGEIYQIYFEAPYLLDRLKNSYAAGVWDRIRIELNDSLIISGVSERLAEEAYKAGRLASKIIYLEVPLHFLSKINISTEKYEVTGSLYLYDRSSCIYIADFEKIESPFQSKQIWSEYLRGLSDYLNEINSNNNVAERKTKKRSKIIGVVSIPFIFILIFYLISIAKESESPVVKNKNIVELQGSFEKSDSRSENVRTIKSDSIEYMGQILGRQISGIGELYYDEDKGCFLKIEQGVIAECQIKTKNVYLISVDCSQYKGLTSIDGIRCGEKINDQSGFRKICSPSKLRGNGYYLRKNKSFYWIDETDEVAMLGITNDDLSLRQESEEEYSAENCSKLNSSVEKSTQNTSVPKKSEVSVICDLTKGRAISTCVNMSTGLVGMASCNEAVALANKACQTTNMSIFDIMDEALKDASK
jgi:hypothetical protein